VAEPDIVTVTIANGQSLSPFVAIGPKTLVGIGLPAAWTAASLTFQVTLDGGVTFLEFYDGAGAVTLPVAAGQFVAIPPVPDWGGVVGLKVRSGTSGSPVNQAADRLLSLVTRTVGF
jgi:hypothetical protein